VATEAQALTSDWGGGVHPYRVGHRKLGMWLFIMSDSLTFSALLIGYAYLRASNVWPTPFKFYPSIVFSSVMTLVLLSSSLTMVMAVSASAHRNRSKARMWIIATAVLGATFFGITGMHMFHVLTGCIYLLIVAARVNKLKHEDVEISGLYWHFVDLVWMFVFPMIYLLSVYSK